MKNLIYILTIALTFISYQSNSSIIRLDNNSLMHEVRQTEYPLNGDTVLMNPARLMWPDEYPHLGNVFDGVHQKPEPKPRVTYLVKVSSNPDFTGEDVITAKRHWAFFNLSEIQEAGKYYWQYAFVDDKGVENWSSVYHFFVGETTPVFNPPTFSKLVSNISQEHPRILFDADQWDALIERNKDSKDAKQFIKMANSAFKVPLPHISKEIDTTSLAGLTNIVQKNSNLIMFSRKIVDREEKLIESLVRAYALTLDKKYYQEAMRRLKIVLSWKGNRYFAGDFNESTLLSMSTSAYDVFYNILPAKDKALLLDEIQTGGRTLYGHYVNHLENRIADNHVWQMTLRILTKAAFVSYGKFPEATEWADYAYNIWLSRLPGLNQDGSWHNGDSYFHVNIKTLIEVPELYSRISGFDFFDEPWYNNNALYVIYHQPPFSKSSGHGTSHESKSTPASIRIGYADAIARECNNPWAAAYVSEIQAEDPEILQDGLKSKSGDLTWYRCMTDKQFPKTSKALSQLPNTKVFNQNGVATMHTSIGDYRKNVMLSFRSSPYGSSSHALSNQNSFNTFYGGEEIFYSSGNRTGFTDNHMMYSYRNTRAHNTILVDGKVQRIGVDGYGWIPRFYEGNEISYFVGDASNAYGKIGTKIWKLRAELSEIDFSPENGWDENKLDFFRRHVIQLGKSGIYVIYDELIGKEAVKWSYLLHTRDFPMQMNKKGDHIEVIGTNSLGGSSTATIFSSSPCTYNITDKFFSPAINWKKKSNTKNNYHFTAESKKAKNAQFLTIIDTHGKDRKTLEVTQSEGKYIIGDWTIEANLDKNSFGAIKVSNSDGSVSLDYDYNSNGAVTTVNDLVNGKSYSKELVDDLPPFDI